VRRERDELEDSARRRRRRSRPRAAVGGGAAYKALRARAGVDPGRLDADDAAHLLARGGGDPDQRDHLLGRELRDGRPALVRVARNDPHLGEQRLLPVDDAARDVLGEVLDEERVVVDDTLNGLLEELREARHVDALPARVEVDRAVDGGCNELLAAPASDPDSLLDACHADAREAERDFWDCGLQVGRLGALHQARLDL